MPARRPQYHPLRHRPARHGMRVAGALSLAILTGSGIGHAVVGGLDDGIGRVDVFDGVENRPDAGAGVNFLVVGTDSRQGITLEEKERMRLGGRACDCTDTIMVVHLSADRSRVSVVSIPRDSYVELPRHDGPDGGRKLPVRPAKINAAYAYGGPELTVEVVEKATGVHIDHYLEVDFTSFMETVDALGGIKVCTVRPLKDDHTGLDLPAGTTLLDGDRALRYVRSRHIDGDGDLARMQRQQGFLAQVVDRITGGDVLTDPAKLHDVTRAVLGSVRADRNLRPADLVSLARGMRDFSSSGSEFTAVPVSDTSYDVPGVGSTVKWDEGRAGKLWRSIRTDRPIATHRPGPGAGPRGKPVAVDPATVRVQVDNGTGVPGLGLRTDTALRATGFDTTRTPGNSAVRDTPRTIIRYDPWWDRSVRSLAAALPDAELQEAPGQGPTMHVTVGAVGRRVVPVRPETLMPDGTDDDAVTGDRAACS